MTTTTPPQPRIVIGPEHGEAWRAGLRLSRALRNAMEPHRHTDPGIAAILDRCDRANQPVPGAADMSLPDRAARAGDGAGREERSA